MPFQPLLQYGLEKGEGRRGGRRKGDEPLKPWITTCTTGGEGENDGRHPFGTLCYCCFISNLEKLLRNVHILTRWVFVVDVTRAVSIFLL